MGKHVFWSNFSFPTEKGGSFFVAHIQWDINHAQFPSLPHCEVRPVATSLQQPKCSQKCEETYKKAKSLQQIQAKEFVSILNTTHMPVNKLLFFVCLHSDISAIHIWFQVFQPDRSQLQLCQQEDERMYSRKGGH